MPLTIRPMSANAGGSPGTDIGAVNLGSTSPDRRAAAKAAFQGVSIKPSETPVDPETDKKEANVRRITMRTNRTTLRYEPPADPAPGAAQAAETGETPTLDPNVQANEAAEETKPLSPQLAELARQRRALQVKERELADREKALEAKSPGPSRDEYKAELKAKTLSVLQEAGVTYDDLTQAILAQQSGVSPELIALRDKVEALEKGVDTKLSERDQAAEQAVLADIRRNVDGLSREGDDFEMIRTTKSQSKVVDLIHRTWQKTGEIIDESEAMALVEAELVNDYLPIAQTKKVQSKLTPAPEPQQPQPQRQIKTLTNRDTASRPLSRKERAMAAFHGTLRK